jgi:hypothetical protein
VDQKSMVYQSPPYFSFWIVTIDYRLMQVLFIAITPIANAVNAKLGGLLMHIRVFFNLFDKNTPLC